MRAVLTAGVQPAAYAIAGFGERPVKSSCGSQHRWSCAPHARRQAPARWASPQVLAAAAAVSEADAGVPAAPEPWSKPRDLQRYLISQHGWEKSWSEQIISDMYGKAGVKTTQENVEAAIEYLTSLDIPSQHVCNMATIVPKLLAVGVEEQLKPVVEHIQSRGVTGKDLVRLLELHPKLLIYEVGAHSLEMGRARAKVDVLDEDGKRMAGVSYFSVGAAFQASPVSPWKPKDD